MSDSHWPAAAGFAAACGFGAVLARGWPWTSSSGWDALSAVGTLLAVFVALIVASVDGYRRKVEQRRRTQFAYALVAIRLGALAGGLGSAIFAARTMVKSGSPSYAVDGLGTAIAIATRRVHENAGLPIQDLPSSLAYDILSAFTSVEEASATFEISEETLRSDQERTNDVRTRVILSNLEHAYGLVRRVVVESAAQLSSPISIPADMQRILDEEASEQH